MKNYQQNFEFTLTETAGFQDKLQQYFETYGFATVKDQDARLLFVKKGSLLEGWKINPLHWKSQIEIHLAQNNTFVVNHTVESNGFLSPIAFCALFTAFILNMEQFVNSNNPFKEKNLQQIQLAKKKVYTYHAFLVVGVLLGLVSGIILTNLTDMKLFGFVGVILGALTTEKIINQQLIKKYSVPS